MQCVVDSNDPQGRCVPCIKREKPCGVRTWPEKSCDRRSKITDVNVVQPFLMPGTKGVEAVHWALLFDENKFSGHANFAESRSVTTISEVTNSVFSLAPSQHSKRAPQLPHTAIRELMGETAVLEDKAPI